MEWIWVGLLFLIMFGPIVLLAVRRRRREHLSQAPDALMEAYRHHFEQGPRGPRG
jgi:hypothetical protein